MARDRTRRSRRAPGWPTAAGLAAGVLADALLGDPQRAHPVALFGRAAAAFERRCYADSRARGALFAATCVSLAAGPFTARARPGTRLALVAACTWAVVGARSLTTEAERIRRALDAGDLHEARLMLPSLCGRDPSGLDAAGIARGVVESLAENTSDAIVAPLLWGAVAGSGGLCGYRAVNTLDAMVGHHSPRYERFGWAAARLDDVANWAPARLTALLAAACAPLAGGRRGDAWRAAARDGPRHPSPNAGWCEAAFAGALGVRLGGTLSYEGRVEDRPELGSGPGPEAADIARAIRLSRAVTAAAAALTAAVALAGG